MILPCRCGALRSPIVRHRDTNCEDSTSEVMCTTVMMQWQCHHTTPHHTTPHHTTPHHTTPHHTTPPLSTRGRRSVQFVCVLKGTLDAPALKHVTSLGECRHPCGALVHIYYATSFVWQREVGRRSCRRYVGTKKYEIPYVITRTRLVV